MSKRKNSTINVDVLFIKADGTINLIENPSTICDTGKEVGDHRYSLPKRNNILTINLYLFFVFDILKVACFYAADNGLMAHLELEDARNHRTSIGLCLDQLKVFE